MQHDAGGRAFAGQGLDHLQAAQAGHAGVQDQDLGLVPAHRLQCVLAVAAAGQDLGARLGAKQQLDPLKDEGVIVGDHEADGHRSSSEDGLNERVAASRASRRRNISPFLAHASGAGGKKPYPLEHGPLPAVDISARRRTARRRVEVRRLTSGPPGWYHRANGS